MNLLSEDEVNVKKKEHFDSLCPFVENFRKWRNVGKKHPVYDFLFTYYSFSGGELLRWTPGMCSQLKSLPQSFDWHNHYTERESLFFLDTTLFPSQRKKYLDWAISYLEKTQERQAIFHCFGLHEWAMVYKSDKRHHPDQALRLSDKQIQEIVSSHTLCCTHYDAYRFFTPSAKPRNLHELKRERVMEFDQRGCVHVNMDLYRFTYKIAPFISSETMKRAFLLAKEARELDMRASPYDLSEYKLTPICIETEDGKKEYIRIQQEISKKAQSLREDLVNEYKNLRERLKE